MYLVQTLQPEDEVIILEPYFPWYVVQNQLQEVNIKYVRYKQQEQDYQLDIDWSEVQSQCNKNTKFIMINSPHNPSGKVMNEKDFESLYQICKQYPQLNIISDEVYEMVYFLGDQFPRISNYKDLFNRVVSVYSGGKTFSCTGWRLGWAIGPENLISQIKNIQKQTSGDTNGMLMDAMAETIVQGRKKYEGCQNYYSYLRKIFIKKKDCLIRGLQKSKLDFKIIEPEGGYFVLCNIEDSIKKMPISFFYQFDSKNFKENENQYLKQFEDWRKLKDIEYMPDEAFSNFLTKNYKVTPIPCNDFYSKDTDEKILDDNMYKYLRFAICKDDQDIKELNQNFEKNHK